MEKKQKMFQKQYQLKQITYQKLKKKKQEERIY